MIEAAYKLAPLSISSFKTMQKACHIYFANKVLPTFINLDTMHSDDQAAIMTGKNSSVSHFFKVSQCLKLHRTDPLTVVKNETEMCPIQRQVGRWRTNFELWFSSVVESISKFIYNSCNLKLYDYFLTMIMQFCLRERERERHLD